MGYMLVYQTNKFSCDVIYLKRVYYVQCCQAEEWTVSETTTTIDNPNVSNEANREISDQILK
jgi:hypothetical protein